MKILIISTDQKILQNGSAVRNRMVKYGELFDQMHIVLFSCRQGKMGVNNSDALAIDALAPEGIHKLADNIFVYPTNSRGRFFYIRDAKKVIKKFLAQDINFDVVSTQDPFETGLVGVYAKKLLNCRLNIQIHTDFNSKYFLHTILNRLRVKIAKKVMPMADSIRVVSKRIKDSLPEKSKSIATIVPIRHDSFLVEDGLNEDSEIPSKFKKPFPVTLLTVSRLEKEKNIETILEALSLIKDDKIGLVIVGDGSARGELEKISDNLGLSERVIFSGHKDDQDDVESFYRAADVYVQTSLYEGYGLSLLDAARFSLPIITTDVGLIGDVLRQGSCIITYFRDPRDLKEKIENLIKDPDMMDRLSQNAHSDWSATRDNEKDETYFDNLKKALS